jgi:hypothetical protein
MSDDDLKGITRADLDEAIRILKEDAEDGHRTEVLARLDRLEGRINRMPVKELSAEEKAAEYDRIMSERESKSEERSPEVEGGKPPAPEPKTEKEETAQSKARKTWFDSDRYQTG